MKNRFLQALHEAWWRSLPIYVGMSTLAISQPMLDLYGKNLPVFSTAKVSRYEIAMFVVILVAVPVLIASFVEFLGRLINPRSGLWIRHGFIGLFGVFFFLTMFRQIGINVLVVVFGLALAGAWGIVWLVINKPWAKTFVSYLAIAAPLVIGIFVLNTQEILFPGNLPIASIDSDSTTDSERPPIVLVVIDEAPLYSLLDADGNINKERFPNLAQLSSEATWHRNATAASNWTAQAVPAILTAKLPQKGDLPIASQHPENIFTALAGQYPLNVYEPITSLCPLSLCKSFVPIGERWNNARFRGFLKDALVVFGHRILPESLRDNLPAINEGWGGFAGENVEAPSDNEDDRMSLLRAYGALGPTYQTNILRDLTSRMSTATTPEAYVAHLLVPHRPWRATPDERVYKIYAPDVPQDVVPSDEDERRTMYQRYLLQMAMVDTALGQMIEDMKQANVWDKAMVVLTADHGLTLELNSKVREAVFDNPVIVDDLYRVPMFVKLPQQNVGETTNCAVSVLDILPTILSVAQIDSDWIFDGRDVSAQCPSDTSRVITSPSAQGVFTNSIETLFQRSAYYDALVTREGGTDQISAVGASASLIGKKLQTNSNDSYVTSWSVNELSQFENISVARGSRIPVQLKGVISTTQAFPSGAEGIVTIDGVPAGVITELAGAQGDIEFDVIINYQRLTGGAHDVGLIINFDGGGTDLRMAPAPSN